jgi:hypothetical protein
MEMWSGFGVVRMRMDIRKGGTAIGLALSCKVRPRVNIGRFQGEERIQVVVRLGRMGGKGVLRLTMARVKTSR